MGTPPEMSPITKDPGNGRIRIQLKSSQNLSVQLQKLAEIEYLPCVQFFLVKKVEDMSLYQMAKEFRNHLKNSEAKAQQTKEESSNF